MEFNFERRFHKKAAVLFMDWFLRHGPTRIVPGHCSKSVRHSYRAIFRAQLHAGGVQVELTGQNLSHTRYLPILEFRLIFRSSTRDVSIVLDTGKQCVWIAIHNWQAMRVFIHTHISCRLLVEGSAPKPLFEHRISFCGCAFCERF